MFSYDYRADNNEAFRKEYYQYAYDEQTGTYNQKVYNESSPSNMRREFYDKSQMLGQFTVNYDRTFNDRPPCGWCCRLGGTEAQR